MKTIQQYIEELNNFIITYNRYPTKIELNKSENLPYYNKCLKLFGNQPNWYSFGITKPTILYKSCKVCNGDVIKSENIFCSSSCSAKFNNSKRISRKCINCFKSLKNRAGKSWCSCKCQREHELLCSIDLWIINDHTTVMNKTLRKILAMIYGYKCSNLTCGISNWNNKDITLEVEHKNGNSEDSSVANICLLCPNCHSQTSTYKGRNRGNGRHTRLQRYHDGKSY